MPNKNRLNSQQVPAEREAPRASAVADSAGVRRTVTIAPSRGQCHRWPGRIEGRGKGPEGARSTGSPELGFARERRPLYREAPGADTGFASGGCRPLWHEAKSGTPGVQDGAEGSMERHGPPETPLTGPRKEGNPPKRIPLSSHDSVILRRTDGPLIPVLTAVPP